ncbi:T9SS type A sorting domain-containing protein [Xanthovirga aplysinae]|uniref:T9SS type A sorting domain-containing protein n=1 Tax=Xanthovirga aplysinae TaxID=2529853 RepID=UPI0012BD802D|nr:T9SS type A sorting domain-containing protein [Xanthovirga aplysinae]MTI31247.1 T9SS type A sorting domain-containing protein [Xanthovirga aplysinae]
MKWISCLFFLVFLFNLKVSGQTYNSISNEKGDWENSEMWTEGMVPQDGGEDITVNILGDIVRNSSLDFSGSTVSILEEDTLWIEGDLIINATVTLNIGEGGIFVVNGNVIIGENSVAALHINGIGGEAFFGTMVVTGDFIKGPDDNAYYSPSGDEEVYVYNDASKLKNPVSGAEIEPKKEPELDEDIREWINNRSAALPITLHSFAHEIKNKSVHLNWITAMELNFDYFTLERSSDGVFYEPIGTLYSKVEGNSDTPTVYEFTDQNPLLGSSYYRLKATDIDGTVEYHDVLEVWYEDMEKPVVLYPNPLKPSEDNLQLIFPIQSGGKLKIFDLFGKKVFEQNFEKEELVTQPNGFHLSVDTGMINLPSGTYTLNVYQGGGKTQNERFIRL